MLVRSGWPIHSQNTEKFTNRDENGSHTTGFSSLSAQWIAEKSANLGNRYRNIENRRGLGASLATAEADALLLAR